MSNRRVKSLDYDDDDFDDYEEDTYEDGGDEVTEEDREQLQKGTQQVRAVLGPDFNVSDKEIQESLWHYYYDVDKTVNYLLNQKASVEAKTAKQTAQKKAQVKPPPQTAVKNGVDKELATGVEKVQITETPRVKSKNLDVIAEYGKSKRKNALNFVVIGHVDAGKSTLMGRLLLDLGVFDKRTHAKNTAEAEQMGKGSFALAWMMDQGSEERERGVTIDIAQNKFETPKTIFTILDAPGHRDFIPNMIAGAAQADFAVLVLDASTGAFESGLKGQTKEHALLARSIGVTRLVVAVNKLDTQSWSHARFDEIVAQTNVFLSSVGFLNKNLTFVPCSGLTGDNVTHRLESREAVWYDGPILLEALEQSDPIKRAIEGPLRLPIADVFRGGLRHPLSIAGRIDSGTLQVGDMLLAVPSNNSANVRGIEVDQEPADYAVAGQNVVIHLGDIDPAYLRTGDILCSPDQPLQSVKEMVVKVLAFDHVTPMHLDVHRGRLHVPAKVTEMRALLDKASGQVIKKRPKLVKPGEVAKLKLVVEGNQGLPLEKGMRAVLRAGGETIAAGVLD